MNNERLKYLFDRYVSGTCTPEERQELAVLGLIPHNESEIDTLLEECWNRTPLTAEMPEETGALIFDKIMKQRTVPIEHLPTNVVKLYWKKITVAASIVLVVGIGSYLIFTGRKSGTKNAQPQIVSHDVKSPATSRAMITLTNGSTIYLDSAGNGTLTSQGSVKLVKLADGQIAYSGSSGEMIYNTLTNPHGSKNISMTLSDGTRVWLNAGSSVTYPVSFPAGERNVSISGEAYFEVSRDPAKPFSVRKGEMTVTVLGTHFNVNAYDDEPSTKVTLLEGSVKVNNTIIRPGEQAHVSGDTKVLKDVDIDEVMAWRNGLFNFNGYDVRSMMREIARWYDLEIVYEGEPEKRELTGEIQRNLTLNQLMKVLKDVDINYRLEGRKLIISTYRS